MALNLADQITFSTRELTIDPLAYAVEMRATREFLNDYPGAAIDYRKMVAASLDNEIHRMTLTLNAHKGEPIVITYPKTWWDAFKLEFKDRWWLRWLTLTPPAQVAHYIHPWAVMPDLKLPPGQRVLRWAEHVAPSFKAWHIEDDEKGYSYARPTDRRS